MNSVFLFFSLHTHILPFTVTECIIGDTLIKRRVQPLLMKPLKCTCRLIEHFSSWSDSYKVECPKCQAEEKFLKRATPGWKYEILSNYAKLGDDRIVTEHLDQLTPENIKSFLFQGAPVGQIAIYDVILKYKQDTIKFDCSSEIWKDYSALVKGAMLCKLWMERALANISPRGIMVYNSNYSINRTVCYVADANKVPRFSMHGGASLKYVWETLMLVKGDIYTYKIACRNNWSHGFSARKLTQKDVRFVGAHFEELFVGKNAHAYSPPLGSASCDELIAKINPLGSRKVVLLALSSADERVAFDQSGIRSVSDEINDIFASQVEWLEFLLSKARQRNDLAFIIRVHPREFPNKRESRTSENAKRLRQYLVNLPDNVIVNWPDQEISYYELIQHVDLVLSIWSSVLLEASLFGCPIVLPQNPIVLYLYDKVADAFCTSPDMYWEQILNYLEIGWSIERSIQTFRWYWFIQHGGTVNLHSDQTRKYSLREKLHSKVLECLQSFQKLAYTKGLNVSFNLALEKQVFGGELKKLTQRSVNPIGEALILETLLRDFDPMADFQKLGKLQTVRENRAFPAADLSEKQAVISELKYLLSFIPQSVGAEFSNINRMIQRAEKSDLFPAPAK